MYNSPILWSKLRLHKLLHGRRVFFIFAKNQLNEVTAIVQKNHYP